MTDQPSRLSTCITLDGQLVGYWGREAARLDALASSARFGWQRRQYARKAILARTQATRFAAREDARVNVPEPAAT